MIPVSEWFDRRNGQPAGAVPAAPVQMEQQAATRTPDPIAGAHERGREEGLALARDEACAALETERALWQARMEDLEADWCTRFSTQVSDAIAATVGDGLRRLESSLQAVLTPFLEERVRAEATARLCAMAEQEIGRLGSSLIEIRAPVPMHDRLREALSCRGLSAAIIADDTVQVTGREGTAIFDSLAERWLSLVRGEIA